MFGKLAGAFIGNRLAGRNEGVKGALLGYGATALARRGLGTLGMGLALGWGAKKLWERRQNRRHPSYPSDAAPSSPSDR
ncbi:MAG: hypothetical protein M3Y43_11060 [Pseudomonadota bacterium]|nr:hypothetical protein [Pseudomonadota bacterium]